MKETMMDDQERAMRMAVEEIRGLRRRNEILEAKVEVMNLFGLTLHTQPAYPTQGMGEDAAWLLQRILDDLETKRNTPSQVLKSI
jgi:hypothetical protein